jgi:SpoVK/Ycf46/Vps4 family AAA+-type ATPase
MTDQLASPDFISLLMNKKEAVLILEDAEKAVQERGGNGNDSAVATLLNLADGILGSLLNISIIVTYNADRQFIDKALLRKGRLSFDYDFGPLKTADAARLMKHLGKDAAVEGPMTLADIYGVEDDTGHTPVEPKQVGFSALLSSQEAKRGD